MKTKIILGFLGVLLCLNLIVWYQVSLRGDDTLLSVAFMNVGQGDAIFIEAPGGNQMLIDAGKGERILSDLSRHVGFFDRSIDVLVVTHPHKDHLGGMLQVLKRYDIGTVFISGTKSSLSLDERFRRILKERGISFRRAVPGMVITLDNGVVFEILAPFDSEVEALDPNTASIVGKLSYGKTSFFFTGDAPSSVERYLAFHYGSLLSSDVLKAGHHGSQTASSGIFLSAVDPKHTIISAGIPSGYGHPDPETLKRILESGSRVWHTVKHDGVVFFSNGIRLVDIK